MAKDVKERSIVLKLTDEDCERLMNVCGKCNLTVEELIENFIMDLVHSDHSNGSDEEDCANKWLDRCGFESFQEISGRALLGHLILYNYHPEDYISNLENIETAEEEKEYLIQHPEEADEGEVEGLDEDIKVWKEELDEMRDAWGAGWKLPEGRTMEEEITNIKKWMKEKERLLEGMPENGRKKGR